MPERPPQTTTPPRQETLPHHTQQPTLISLPQLRGIIKDALEEMRLELRSTPPINSDGGRWLKISEALQYMGCCRSKFYKMRQHPLFPEPGGLEPGGALRWWSGDLDKWLRLCGQNIKKQS